MGRARPWRRWPGLMLASLLALVLAGAAYSSPASDGCEYRLVAVLQSPDPCSNGERARDPARPRRSSSR